MFIVACRLARRQINAQLRCRLVAFSPHAKSNDDNRNGVDRDDSVVKILSSIQELASALKKIKNQKSVKITTQAQFVHLVSFRESHKDFARGRLQGNKEVCEKLWGTLSEELNAICLPNRNAEGWKKVWKDLKYNLKKKLLHNKKEQKATGGGSYKQHQFSAYEKTAISILAIDKIVNVEGATHGLNLTPINNDDEMDVNPVSAMSSPTLSATGEKAPSRKTKNFEKSKENKMAERIDLLKEHTKLFQNIEKKTSDMAYYMKRTLKVKEEKLALLKQDLLDQKRHRDALLEIKQRHLELKSRQI